MSEDCNTKRSLRRDGTSQAQRLVEALLPEYVSVDERSMDDLIAFVKKLATEFQYYNIANAPDGDWVGFFTKSISDEQRTEPHYALFIAFLELFAIAQEDLNTITKRHLDYYYREVLRLQERPAVPDQVFILFELAEQLSSSLVPQGKELDAKKDATGVDLIYKTDKDLVVNRSKVEQLKAIFVNRPFDPAFTPQIFPVPIPTPDPNLSVIPNSGNDWRIYASPVANSADGLGADINEDPKRWRTFGIPHDANGTADRPQGEIGFAFASPVLFLAEGTRTVTFKLNFSPPPATPPPTLSYPVAAPTPIMDFTFTEMFAARAAASSSPPPVTPPDIPIDIHFSGEEGWLLPDLTNAPTFAADDSSMTIVCVIGKGQKAVVAYNEEVLLQPFKTQWPVAKLTLNTTSPQWAAFFNHIKSKVLYTADITVDVEDVRTLVLQNDNSILATEKPFQPFTNTPVPGSTFYIGSNEVFQKKLSSLDINITWHALPSDAALYPQGFKTYYENYLPADQALKRNNQSFTVDAYILDKKEWKAVNDVQPPLFSYTLFANANGTPLNNNFKKLSIDKVALSAIPREPGLQPVEEFDSETLRGFMRLKLGEIDFGHSIYQTSFSKQAIDMAKNVSGAVLPPEPYTPEIKEIFVNYSSTQTLDMIRQSDTENAENYKYRVDQFFHVMPFGVAEEHPYIVKTSVDIPLMPQFPDEGSLYIGVSNMEAPQTISLLFKTAEGSEDPDLEKQNVNWSYMVNNEWFAFTQLERIADTTNGLLTSGILTFDVPKAITSDNTALPAGLCWLKAAITRESRAVCDLIDVKAQAVTATFADNGNDPEHLRLALPAETIKDFVESDAAIETISQPYASFGGKVQEQSIDFYVRVSERLRHKHRAITIVDYERIVLERFPAVYKVKCLNHTRYISNTDINELRPGHVSLVLIANLRNKNAVDPLKPKASQVLQTEVNDYIRTLNPPCAQLYVRNPIFEEILVDFNVRFLPGFDIGFYAKKLNEELKQFLAPWAYGTKDIVFGGRVHKSMVLNFVEDRPYVDFVTCFNMDHIVPGLPNQPNTIFKNVDEAVTTTSASVLTSVPLHRIHVLENDECNCDDNEITRPVLSIPEQFSCDDNPVKIEDGIGHDEIGTTFIIGHSRNTGIDYWVIEKDFDVQ